jgi:hypothetical protein
VRVSTPDRDESGGPTGAGGASYGLPSSGLGGRFATAREAVGGAEKHA